MSQLFIVPTNENGLILDTQIAADIKTALSHPFSVEDIYIYAHGWWTSPQGAVQDYNQFTVEQPPGALGIGVQWPSMLFNSNSLLSDMAEAATFYEMETRADSIGANAGYALLRCVLQSAPPRRKINLIGHSFGCKVICSMLQELYEDRATIPFPAATELNVVLLQPAFDNDDLEYNNIYGDLAAAFPNLRLLVTTSQLDRALGVLYPHAERLNLFKILGAPRVALGFGGPTTTVQGQFAPVASISVGPGFTTAQLPPRDSYRMLIADLTLLHADPSSALYNDPLAGHHGDIFRDETYALIGEVIDPFTIAAIVFGGLSALSDSIDLYRWLRRKGEAPPSEAIEQAMQSSETAGKGNKPAAARLKQTIDDKDLEVIRGNIDKAKVRMHASLVDPANDNAAKDYAVEIASSTICAELKRIRRLNRDELPGPEYETWWRSHGCIA